MAKAKRSKGVAQRQYEKYRNAKWLYTGAGYLSLALPISVIMGVNHEKYFYYAEAGWTTGAGFALAAFVLVLSFLVFSKKNVKDNIVSMSFSIAVEWFAWATVLFLLRNIINDLAMIMYYEGIGLLGALFVFSPLANDNKEKQRVYKEEMVRNGADADFEADKAFRKKAAEDAMRQKNEANYDGTNQ